MNATKLGKRRQNMDNEARSLNEPDDDILTVDVPDEALERAAAVADGRVLTLIACTQDLSCGPAD
jgi:hypothetical protein